MSKTGAMRKTGGFLVHRRLLIGLLIFGLFVIFDIALFGYLIFNSLSQRELEEVVLEARSDVEPLAEALAAQAEQLEQDLWVVVSVAYDTQDALRDVLDRRPLVQRIEIRDREGRVVLTENAAQRAREDGVPQVAAPSAEPAGTPIEGRASAASSPIVDEIEIPIIGDGREVGVLVIGLSDEALRQRIGVLRADLIRQASLIGGLTVTLLGMAYAAIWWLLRHSRALEAQALEAERMAAIGTLASGLAHEIRNPLNSLSLNMQMLEEEADETQARGASRRLLGITRSEISRLERLVTDFLSYARPRPLERQAVPAVQLLERAASVLAAEIRDRRATVRIEDTTDGAAVEVDAEQMNQLLLNLIQNALGAIVDARDREGPDGPARGLLRLCAVDHGPEPRVALAVIDDGGGIPEADRARIFEAFYSTRKGGTGLGLAVVQRIANTHGAEIEVESVEGEGTTVAV
ncbi:MAG: ATP-binding protein, partial [Acidobacteriota bacterium]